MVSQFLSGKGNNLVDAGVAHIGHRGDGSLGFGRQGARSEANRAEAKDAVQAVQTLGLFSNTDGLRDHGVSEGEVVSD